jgi:hypothetical protein
MSTNESPFVKVALATGLVFVISLYFSSLLTLSMDVKLVAKVEKNERY